MLASRVMASIWVESIGRSLEQSLDLLAAAVRDCTDDLWQAPMWQVPVPDLAREIVGPEGKAITDATERRRLVQRHSTPWGVAWHALECLDYDLNGEFGPWAPPPPFAGHPHWRDLTSLPVPWSRPEMLGYVDYCRSQAADVLERMTEEKAARALSRVHRYRDQPHAWIIAGLVVHTTEHASQIRQFITGAGMRHGR